MAERRPRIDPREGDVLRKGSKTRVVVSVEGCTICGPCEIHYRTSEDCPGKVCWIDQWKAWAKDAVVEEYGPKYGVGWWLCQSTNA